MPLFLVTMPLIFLTLAPGTELNPLFSLVPVTGVAPSHVGSVACPAAGTITALSGVSCA